MLMLNGGKQSFDDQLRWRLTPEDLQLPLRSLGYDLVFDYREDQLGVRESYGGAIQVEGAWYCPQMPQVLIDATIDYRVNKSIDEETWHSRIEQRCAYLLRPKERADKDGYLPMCCPALGPSATAICPLKKTLTNASGRVRIQVTPSHPDKICTNKSSVSFPPTAGAKYSQVLRYGSPEWHAMYATARNTIEGFNGYVKDANYEALDQPGRRRVRGYAAQYLFTALLVVSANIRKLQTFLANATTDAAVTSWQILDPTPAPQLPATHRPPERTRTSPDSRRVPARPESGSGRCFTPHECPLASVTRQRRPYPSPNPNTLSPGRPTT
jgi:hypothetical protein